MSDGYGANYLIPNKLAVKATKTSMEIKQKQDDDEALRQAQLKQEAIVLKDKLEKLTLKFGARTGKDGRMFGSISTKQISDELKNKGYNIDKKLIVCDHAIDSLGVHDVKINLHKKVVATVKVNVVA